MYFLYDLVFLLYALVYLPYLLLTKRWYAGFGMRLGIFPERIVTEIKAKANIWVHAVSVGEVTVLDGFIDHLKRNYPDYQIIATVTTKTGYALARERLKHKAIVIPSPLDFSFVAGRFIALINPKIYIAVETEIWPNLFRKIYLKKIPMGIINGRISDASFGRYKAIRFLLKGVLNQVSVWCMQSQKDAQRIMELGTDPSRVMVTGNVKFDDLPKSPDHVLSDFLSAKETLWWVAGSTHSGEEEIVLDVFSRVVKTNPQWRLIIAPPHVERTPQILDIIRRRGLNAVKYSEVFGNSGFPTKAFGNDSIVVLDTIGDLRLLYSIASLVFVGKSLCVGGGHNVIEPAFYGKAIVIGPKVQNFRDIVACFKEDKAIVQVEDVQSFENAVIALCADEQRRKALGDAALHVIKANQGATQRSLDHLAGLLR